MKNWLTNLKIKGKLNLIIGVALVALILLGLTANFFIKTTKVVNIMLIAQRDYMIDYHKSLEYFYQSQADSSKSSLIDEAIIKVGSANDKLELFKDPDALFNKNTYDFDKLVDSVIKVYRSAVADSMTVANLESTKLSSTKDARLLVKRIHLFHILGIESIQSTADAAGKALVLAEKIETVFNDFKNKELSTDEKDSIYQNLEIQLERMVKEEQAYADEVKIISNSTILFLGLSIAFLVLLLGLVIVFLSRAISGMVTKPVMEIRDHLKNMARGDLSGQSSYVSNDEVGQLSDSYRQMKAILAEQIDQAKRVAKGDFENALTPRSEKDELTIALNDMTASLKSAKIRNDRDSWIKTNQNELTTEVQGDIDLSSVGQKISSLIARQLDALTSAMFVFNGEQKIEFIGGFAVNTDQAQNRTFKPGEGLIGQVVMDRQAMVIEEVPDNYLDIYSGLGKQKPRFLMIFPCIYNNTVEGVIELGSLKAFDDVSLEYIKLASESIAIAIQSSKSRTALQELLKKQLLLMEELQIQQEELRQSNEELQVQQEELRQSNEELEAQTRELEASKENLQTQQEELRVTNEELSERTRAIESQRESLRKKNDELEKARQDIEEKAREIEQVSTYKSEFLANMSHELRTPLNSILVLSQILAQNKPENLNEKQIKSAETIKSSGENLLVLINEILDLAKIESGKVELHPEPIEITSLLLDLKETFIPIAEEKGLKLELSVSKDLPAEISNDSLRLGQILRNLIANGIKFTENGTVKINLSRPAHLETLDRKFHGRDDLIGFYVIDSGIGIHKDKQKEIFDAFRQADGTTSRKFGGTGLGLAISRNFARMMGGDIILESHPGDGSTFALIVPENISLEFKAAHTSIVSALKEEPGIKITQEKPRQTEQAFNHDSNIGLEELSIDDDRKNIKKGDTFLLIIEDDVSFAQIIYDLAHEKNFKCMIAPNGETGLHYADYYNPSAIILDIGLPGIDGWEVMKRLQENPRTRHIPVHFMSGSDKSLEALKKGAIGFLQKPVTVNEINDAFDRIEGLISKPLKRLLVVEDDEAMRLSINELIGEENIQITSASRGQEALELLKTETFDAMILDLGLDDMTGYDLLQKIGKRNDAHKMPVIIYTGKELTRDEEEKLQSLSDRIIIKGIKSPERLLAETTLFLHQVESNLPMEKQRMLRNLHPKEDVMKDKSILIVDDDMRNVFALTSLLEDLGLKILVGRNGRDGIDKLKANNVDLILMDIMMPEMNGYEAMEEIRKDLKNRKLPIIALTAKAMPGDREKCIRAGASDYLTKPIDSEKLISMLRVWLYKN
jgi:CheY-like chemotaxis protein/signal transduction histidine kinase/HAMP domain-containing protein